MHVHVSLVPMQALSHSLVPRLISYEKEPGYEAMCTCTHTCTRPLTGWTGITAVGTGDGALRGTPGGKETATGLGNTVNNEGI